MKKGLFWKSHKLAGMAKILRQNLDMWGYEEVFLPAIEKDNPDLDRGTKFVNENELYVIKPDLTSQILNHTDQKKDLKLFYISEVLDGGTKGEWQFGIEHIGGPEVEIQVEALMIAASLLEALNVEDFYIDVGSLKIWENVTKDIPKLREEIYKALYRRNFELISRLPLSDEKEEEIWKLFNYRKRDCSYGKLNKILNALDSERIYADFGTVRPYPYYDDIVFEIYSPKFSHPLGAGGGYHFDGKRSFGFALNLDVLIDSFSPGSEEQRRQVSGELEEKYKKAKKLVSRGTPVEVDT